MIFQLQKRNARSERHDATVKAHRKDVRTSPDFLKRPDRVTVMRKNLQILIAITFSKRSRHLAIVGNRIEAQR